ncbi:MAG: DUF808 domain-containing protein [Bermanella sp.]
MASSSLLALIDDIATILDDVAILSKIAAKKTAGVLGDDLALNAEQVSGVRAERELPVVWAVAKGSFLNKLILVPAALLISAFIPWLITPLLMLGGAYLCFEGIEKLAHVFLHKDEKDKEHEVITNALKDPNLDLVELEKQKIKGAIRTDFVLSAEIIVIALSAVSQSPFLTQCLVVSAVAMGITAAVYGLVAAIVKIDDVGLYFVEKSDGKGLLHLAGRGLLWFAPFLMKTLSIVGTAAMFLVGGGILLHGIPAGHHVVEAAIHAVAGIPFIAWMVPSLVGAVVGILAGIILFLLSLLVPKKA